MLFFFNDPATTEIYTLSLHDALPISDTHTITVSNAGAAPTTGPVTVTDILPAGLTPTDRKSTRLNSSHTVISYAVFCLKKKKIKQRQSKVMYHASTRAGAR